MNAVHHIRLGFPLRFSLATKVKPTSSVSLVLKNLMNCAGVRLVWHSQQVLLPTIAPRDYSKTGILDKFLPNLMDLLA